MDTPRVPRRRKKLFLLAPNARSVFVAINIVRNARLVLAGVGSIPLKFHGMSSERTKFAQVEAEALFSPALTWQCV